MPILRHERAGLMMVSRADDFAIFDDDAADGRIGCRIAQGGLCQFQGFFSYTLPVPMYSFPSIQIRKIKKGYGRKIPIAF